MHCRFVCEGEEKETTEMNKDDLNSFITTLVINNFHLKSVNRISDGNSIINTFKIDKLGAKINYSILVNTANPNSILIDTLLETSSGLNSTPLVVSDSLSSDKSVIYSFSEFSDLIGGFINTGLILIPNLSDILRALGHNTLYEGLAGKPDKLLEIYSKECLQYLMVSPAKRFGSDRLFESLPDGIVLGKNRLIIQFDAKAYSEGFSFRADDIERFSKYVNDFNNRYSQYLGRIYYFLIVSGNFNDSIESINKRSDELFKRCQAKLTCTKSEDLGKIVKVVSKTPSLRNAIDWNNVLINCQVSENSIYKELKRIQKDNFI